MVDDPAEVAGAKSQTLECSAMGEVEQLLVSHFILLYVRLQSVSYTKVPGRFQKLKPSVKSPVRGP